MLPTITLRPYRPEERTFFVALMTDAEVTRYTGVMPVDRAHAIFDVATGVEGAAPVPRVVEALAVDDDRAQLVGHAALLSSPELLSRLDGDGRPGVPLEIGFMLPVSSWGRGYGTAIGQALVVRGRERYPDRPLVATADVANVASIRILQRCGGELVEVVDEDDAPWALYRWPAR